VVALLISILILIVKLFQNINLKIKFMFLKKLNVFFFINSFFILSYLGAKRVEVPFEILSQIFSLIYFFFVLII
jgi:hypothetical protein